MLSNLLEEKNIIVQGITGSHGAFHTASMRASGTNIVAGTSPGKGGQVIDGISVYDSIEAIQKEHDVDTTIIFVPAAHAKSALLEAIKAKVPLIVCITEGIPIHDMLTVMKAAKEAGITIVGPNCPGILMPGRNKLGIIPSSMGIPGSVGVVSRSGTLTYEVAAGLTARGIGQKCIIGIGGDSIRGTDFIDCLEMFEKDQDITKIVMIGEVGGSSEQQAANYISTHVTKPVYVYITGHSAPIGVQLGHAGAILGSSDESAAAKSDTLKKAGAFVFQNITELISTIKA